MGRDEQIDYGKIVSGNLHDYTPEKVRKIYDQMDSKEKAEFEALLRNSPPRSALPHQEVPTHLDWWEVFLLIGGRGVGKTDCGAMAARNHLRFMGKKARIGIGAPTNADARDTCMEGETGLITMFPHEFKNYNRSLGEARHINGGLVKSMGTEQPRKWNGPQWSMVWFDELALCNQAAWDDAMMGLRLGDHPYAVATTTPKNRKWVKHLAMQKTTYVPQYIDRVTKRRRVPCTLDNPFLPKRRVEWLYNKYGNSRLGRQELEGAFVDDIEGALWKRDYIIHETDHKKWPRFVKIVVAIDPAGSRARQVADINSLSEDQRQNQKKNADTAIAVIALGVDAKFYVLAIRAGQWLPLEWGQKAIEMYYEFRADKIIAEQNFGGQMVLSNLQTIDVHSDKLGRRISGRYIPINLVVASKGKDIRAQPVVALYEQKRVIHTAQFAEAEDQMCAFIDADENEGADMVDALVWGVIELGGLDVNVQFKPYIIPADPRLANFIVVR